MTSAINHSAGNTEAEAQEVFDLQRILFTVKKHYKLIFAIIAAFLLFAVLYIALTPARYTAYTDILLDPEQSAALAEISKSNQSGYDDIKIISQVEILKSRDIAVAVLNITQNKNYKLAVAKNDSAVQQDIINSLLSGLQVRRLGETLVISILYTHQSPETAAALANAFATAYIGYQIESQSNTSISGAEWLLSRINELQNKSAAANRAVQSFRVKHDLYTSGNRSINESQVAELNRSLAISRAETAAAKARYMHSRDVVNNGDVNAAFAEALDNDVINTVRSNYLESKKRYFSMRRLVGDNHLAVKSLRQDISEYEQMIFGEMRRIAQSYKNGYDVARSQEQELENSLNQLINVKSSNDTLSAQLDKLIQEAETFEKLYKDYLEKYELLLQQQSFELADIRIISKATPPLFKSHPKPKLILAVALILSSGLGVLAALLIESADSTFKTGRHIRDYLGQKNLGIFPASNSKPLPTLQHSMSKQSFKFNDPLVTEAINSPLSIVAETIRKTRTAIEKQGNVSTIGIISANPGEGKSTVAINLALSLAKAGNSCVLLDMDIHKPLVDKNHFKQPVKGLEDVLIHNQSPAEALIVESNTGLNLLSFSGNDIENALESMNSIRLQKLISYCRENFTYVVINLPPLSVTPDVYGIAHSIDSFITVIEWGKTKRETLKNSLLDSGIQSNQFTGAILNKTDLEKMIKYYGYKMYPQYGAKPV